MSTTTITPTVTRIPLTLTLLSPLHHGAGTAGNTAVLRAHEVIQPDGTHVRVPFVSANSVRHGLRNALAWHLAATLGIEDGSLTKAAVDLLWSGGAVTATGSQVDLEASRRVEGGYAALALLGFAAKSDIYAGTLRVTDLELACRENAWRAPARLTSSPLLDQGAAAFRGEEFGTRHDVASTPVARLVASDPAVGTTQMIYDRQVLLAGSVLYGHLDLAASATDWHRVVLDAAISLWAPDGEAQLAALSSQGYGRARLDYAPDPAALDTWTAHLLAHREDILTLIGDLTS